MRTLPLILCLLTCVTSLIVHKECLVWNGDTKYIDWTGSHIDITSWIPETDQTEALLSLTLYLEATKNNYELFEVHRNNVTIERVRTNSNKTIKHSINIENLLENGWADFNFTATMDFQLFYKSDKILSLKKDQKFPMIHSIVVTGNNFTINCNQLDLGWEMKKGEKVSIPLAINETTYNFSVFSNDPIKPIIMIGQNESQLGRNGDHLVDITIIKRDHQTALLPSVEYFFIISCTRVNKKVECNGLGGKQGIHFKTFGDMDSWPGSLSVKSDAKTYTYFHRPPPLVPLIYTNSEIITPQPENSGVSTGYIITITILVVICGGLVGTTIYMVTKGHGSLSNRYIEDQVRITLEDVISKEGRALINKSPTSSITSDKPMEATMFNAVAENDARYVEFLLQRGINPLKNEKGRSTTPFVEAHILGHSEILQVISLHKNEEPAIPPNELINQIMQEIKKRMKEVFLAATFGMYEQERGVRHQLQGHSLPGTIHDRQGRSLLHYMASKSFMDGRPAWEARHIKSFFHNHEYFINAIDHWGNTALHELAKRKREEDRIVFWDGKEQTLSAAWLAMAEFFLSNGCDPRIPNHQGHLPHELATDQGNHDMARLFKIQCEALGSIDQEKSMKRFDELVAAAKLGNNYRIRRLLLQHVPLLPPCAQSDPLVEAIRHRQRDAVFLLLGAGAPICNRSLMDLTPFETAHSTLGIPACFPALMRKAQIDRLHSEMLKVPGTDVMSALRCGMKDFQEQVVIHGRNAKWKFEGKNLADRSKEARHLLVQASELGLSLTCQLLALEDVYLHALPNEEKPFSKAINNKHVDTQIALYRDLKMSPFTSTSSSIEMLSPRFFDHILMSEFILLERICSNDKDPELHGDAGTELRQYVGHLRKYCESLRGTSEYDFPMDAPPLLLYLVAKRGLDTILHILLNRSKSLDINVIVQQFSKCTSLHVAAMNGELDMIEYLVYNGANLDLTTIGGYSAAHLASLLGHKECAQYILAYMNMNEKRTDAKCDLRLTALEILEKYKHHCNKSPFPLITHETALESINTRGEDNQSYELLKRKSKFLNIYDSKSFSECAMKENLTKHKCDKLQNQAKDIAAYICNQIDDPIFQGKIKSVGHLFEGNDVFTISTSRMIYELTQLHAVGNSASISCRDVVKTSTDTAVEIISTSHQNLFHQGNFIKTFCEAIKGVMAKDEGLLPGASMSPPFVTSDFKGVFIYTVWWKDNDFLPMRILIMPCLRADNPPDSRIRSLPVNFHNFINKNDCVHLHLRNLQGDWLYRGFNCESYVFSNLNRNQKTVWLCCRLILVLLDAVWWAPRFSGQRYELPWHTMSIGVTRLPERAAKALFLKELAECEKWEESDIFERVYAIFARAATKDVHGKWIPRESVNSFITPRHYCSNVAESLGGIMRFLDDLRTPAALTQQRSARPTSIHSGNESSTDSTQISSSNKKAVGFMLSGN